MNINERIRERREYLGLSVAKVAEQVGVSRATLYRYENADIEKIPAALLDRLAKVYGISVGELLGYDREASSDAYTYALYNETKDLSEDAKKQILAMAKFLYNEEKKEERKNRGKK